MKKSVLSGLLLMLIILTVSTVSAETTGTTPDGFTYTIADGAATVTGYTGTATALNIPAMVEGTVPVKSVGYAAFQGCESLVSIDLPATLTSIGDWAFNNCRELNSISFPSGLKTIGSYAFYNCRLASAVTIPDSVQNIGKYAFIQTSITSISIPSSVTTVDGSCFKGCRSLSSINVYSAGSAANYKSISGVLYDASVNTLVAYPHNREGSTYAIEDGTTEIGTLAFAHDAWVKLGDLTVPDSVASCAEDAFINGSTIILHLNSNEYMMEYAERKGITCVMGSVSDEDGSQIKTLTEKVNWIVATYVKPGMSDFQKAVVLHDWLIGHVEYDSTYSKGTAYNALIQGTAICQGYTEAYRLLLNKIGISNQFAYGPNHVWNVVQLGGNWYHIDCQGDDSSWDNHTFFGITDEMRIFGSITYINSPVVCNSVEYHYEYRMGYYQEYLDGLKAKLKEVLISGNDSYSFNRNSEDWQIRTPHYQIIEYDLEKSSWAANGKQYVLSAQYDRSTEQFNVVFTVDPKDTDVPTLAGDANGDGGIDIMDLVSIIDYIVSDTSPTSIANADANEDGTVDIMDLVWIIDQIVGG